MKQLLYESQSYRCTAVASVYNGTYDNMTVDAYENDANGWMGPHSLGQEFGTKHYAVRNPKSDAHLIVNPVRPTAVCLQRVAYMEGLANEG